MANKTTENCAELDRKLEALYGHFKLHRSLKPRVTGPSALAAAVGVSRSTINRWGRRTEETNRDPFQVAPAHVVRLADLFRQILLNPMNEEEAVRLWREATALEFKRRLIAQRPVSLRGVLDGRPPTLKVDCAPAGSSLGMVEIEFGAVEGELILKPGEYFRLKAGTRQGRTLVVLGEGPRGWSLLAPAPEFGGLVEKVPQPFPSGRGWKITETRGPHRVVVIELAAGSSPVGRERVLALFPEQEQLLVEELLDVTRSGDWIWGEARLYVEKSDG